MGKRANGEGTILPYKVKGVQKGWRTSIMIGFKPDGKPDRKQFYGKTQKEVKEKLEETEKIWKNKQDKLAYFIEHNELEKIDTNLVLLKSYIETEEHDETIREINELAFLVKHIEEKYAFNLKNIF